MAERDRKPAKRPASKARASSPAAPTPVPDRARATPEPAQAGGPSASEHHTLLARIATLEGACARLEGDLVASRSRVAELEEQRRQVIDRIDWVIDSLHSLASD